MDSTILTKIRAHLSQLAQADGAGLIAALVLIVLILLLTPPPRKRRVRAAVYLLLIHLGLFGIGRLFAVDSSGQRFFDLASEFFLLACIGRGLFILLTQGLLRRSAERLPKIFLDIIHGLIYLGAFIFILGEAGVQAGSLLTGSALLTAIIGLSLRDTLGNLFAGLALQAQRPYEVGDWIQWDNQPSHIGKVVEINWRATRVLTLDAIEITIPHATLGQGMILNFTKPKRWSRRSVYFHAPMEVPTQTVQQLVLEAIEGSFGVQTDPPPSVVTLAFDERGVQYWLRFFTAEFDFRDRVDGEVRDRIWYTFHRAGILMPPPRRDVALRDESPQAAQREQEEQLAARIRALRCVDFFDALEEECLERLARMSRTAIYGAGEVIIRQGEPGEELFILTRGEVQVKLERPELDSVQVTQLGPGDFFGEMSLLTGEPRSASVKAVRPCELVVVGKGIFGSILGDYPTLAERISVIVARRRLGLSLKREEQAGDGSASEAEPVARLLKRIKDFFSI